MENAHLVNNTFSVDTNDCVVPCYLAKVYFFKLTFSEKKQLYPNRKNKNTLIDKKIRNRDKRKNSK